MADLKISALTASTVPLAGTEVLPIVQSSTTKKVSVANLTDGRAVSMLSATIGPNPATLSGAVVDVGNNRNSPTRFGISNQNSGASATAGIDFEAAGGGWQVDVPADVVTFANPLIGKFNGTEVFRFKSTGSFAPVNGAGIDFSATAGTGTSELLADYEEGDWTATLTGSVSNPTLTAGSINRAYYTKVGRVVYITATIQWTASSGGSGDLSISGLPFTSNNNAGNYGSISVGYNTGIATGVGSILRIYQTPNTTTLSLFGQIDATLSTTTLTTAAIQTTGTVYLIIEGFYFV